MRSVTSWFNVSLYRKNLTRFWPIWGLYLAVWLISFPIGLFLGNYGTKSFAQREVLDVIGNIGQVTALVFSIAAAMALWSYLYNSRSACLMHQLPIRREGLFLTNYLSGLTFFVGPNLIVFVLTLLTEQVVREVNVGKLLIWFAAMTLMEVFYFSLATFCAMFTGHILALPIFYGVLNGLVWIVWTLINQVLSQFLFGYTGFEWMEVLAKWLTPLWIFADVGTKTEWPAFGEPIYHFTGMWSIVIYAVVGLILAAIALFVYRRRHMERSGDTVTVNWVRYVFRYGVAFSCALALGYLLYEIFSGNTAWGLLVCMLICGVVGYFAACMLLEKSFRVFSKWKGCAAFLLVLVVLTCVVEFDLMGYARWVPDEDEIESVRVETTNLRPYDSAHYCYIESGDPEVIDAVLAVHQAIARQGWPDPEWNYEEETAGGYGVQTQGRSGIYVSYTLKDGRTVSRDFMSRACVCAADQDDPTTLTGKLNRLINLPQVTEEAYGLADRDGDAVIEMVVDSAAGGEYYGVTEQVPIDKAAYERVLAAVRKDLEEGNLGRRYLMDDRARMENCFVNDLEIVFYDNGSSRTEVTENGTAIYEAVIDKGWNEHITITLQTTAKHTLAALDEAGVLPRPVYLLTQAQDDALYGKWAEEDLDRIDIDMDEYAWDVLGPVKTDAGWNPAGE